VETAAIADDRAQSAGERAAEDPGFCEGIGAALVQAVPLGREMLAPGV
jgi:hypothetical protein